jgi:hypothetical protein
MVRNNYTLFKNEIAPIVNLLNRLTIQPYFVDTFMQKHASKSLKLLVFDYDDF